MRRTTAIQVALAVSGHGFGHAVRVAEVARALLERGAEVLVRTEAPAWLFPDGVQILPSPGWPIDVGVVQRDGLAMDIDATRRTWADVAPAFEARAAAEADQLRRAGADVLVGDIPPLAFAAAEVAGIPGVALGNFGWDWIYGAWDGMEQAIACVQRGYRDASILLRLPFHGRDADAFPAFGRIHDVPLIARCAATPRAATRARLGLPREAVVVLLSFGGFDATRIDLAALAAYPEYLFLLTPLGEEQAGPAPNVRYLPRAQLDYPSLLAACDVVVTKPGYGIVSDCLANRVPVLYTDRGPFREYPVLAEALERNGPALYLPQVEVLAGRLGPALDRLRRLDRPWQPLRLDGAEVVAHLVLDMFGPTTGV